MRAGPKRAVDPSPLPFDTDSAGSERFAEWCAEFIVVPKGTGARGPLTLRSWQRELVGSVMDASPRPRVAGWMLPRGQGKSSMVAAVGLYDLFEGVEGATVVVAAVDERQAGIVFGTARRMVELNEELASRCQIFKDKLVIPERGASFHCLPATPASLEGLDFTLAIVDEIGVVNRDTYEVLNLAQGKRETSTLIGIGTPGPDPHDSVLLDMRSYGRDNPDDPSFVWREFSATGFEDHPVDCRHCWALANPALGDFLHEDALVALCPPKTRESTFRRARLCQFVSDGSNRFIPPGIWDALGNSEPVPDGVDVVVTLDGSFSNDATALLVATVSSAPHFDVVSLWEPPPGDENYRVPVLDVEDAIRDACRRWNVVEIAADPFRWQRTLQVLESEGLPIIEFPHSPARLTAATADLYRAIVDGEISHSGDPRLARHVENATVIEDNRGARLAKERRASTRRIDLAACAVMAHSRATWRATRKTRKKVRSFQ